MKSPLAPESSLPKTDPRVKLLAARLKKENYRHDALIEILHTVQNAYGHLPLPVLQYVARELHMPPSRVYATATFYHFFSLKTKGVHTCLVCTGTACYVKGAQLLLKKLEEELGIKPGETTADNQLTVQVARCIGACGLAPAVIIDESVQGKVTPEQLIPEVKAKLQAS